MNAKQKSFANEWLIDKNATQAAIRAGYSKHTAGVIGSKLLKNLDIAAYLLERTQTVADKLGIDAEWVLRGTRDIALKTHPVNPEPNAAVSLKAYERLGKYLKVFDQDDTKQDMNVSIQIVQF